MANNRYVLFQTTSDFDEDDFPTIENAAKAHVIDQVSEDISMEHGFNYPITSAKRAARNKLKGPIIGGGEIGVPMYSRGFPTLAYYALGKVTTTANTPISGVHQHVLEPGGSVPAFVLGVGKDKKEHRFLGCGMKSMKLDYSVDNPALATFDVLCRKELTPADFTTGLTFPDYDVLERAFLGVEVTATIGDSSVGYVRSASIEINNTVVEDNHVFGTRFIPELITQELEVTGNMTMSFNDIARYTDVHNETERAIKLTFANGSGTSQRKIEVNLPKASYDMVKLPTDGNKEFIVNVDFTAQSGSSNTPDKVVEMTIVNAEAAADFKI